MAAKRAKSSKKVKTAKASSGGKGNASRPAPIRQVLNRAISHLPRRPRRPVTGYRLFVRNYFAQERTRKAAGRRARKNTDVIRAAAKAWSSLSDEKREEYNDQTRADRNRYQTRIAAWTAQRQALKRPASSYGLFTREIWEREQNNSRPFDEMVQLISQEWNALPQAARDQYKNISDKLFLRFRNEIERVNEGHELNVNWMSQSLIEGEENVQMDLQAEENQQGTEEDADESEEFADAREEVEDDAPEDDAPDTPEDEENYEEDDE